MRNAFITLNNDNIFTFWRFACKERNNFFPKSYTVRDFFLYQDYLNMSFWFFAKVFYTGYAEICNCPCLPDFFLLKTYS